METAISIQDLNLAIHGKPILQGVNASIPEGGCTVLVGPNGAGKTTLLLCLLKEVSYKGSILFSPSIRDFPIGYVPQSLSIDSQMPMTVGEFLSLGRRTPLWFLRKRRAPQTQKALKIVDMEASEGRCLGDLSGGELRRILLASALLASPRLLLLDEPSAGVDVKGERLFWDVLDEVRTTIGITVVMVSHNLSLAAHYATHVLCIHGGGCFEGEPRSALTAGNLMKVFGTPIHLYPDQCSAPQFLCPKCGAFGMEDDESIRAQRGDAASCLLQHGGVTLAPRGGCSCCSSAQLISATAALQESRRQSAATGEEHA